ncbi:MAG: thioredoxin fold domain-containing protein [Bacteroidetes bacterium]|nr:thioredoxin fold domain-containing protein [Bacteroidota bacterium]
MKSILFICAFLFVGVSTAQEIQWMSMNEALEAQKKNPKKIFMDVYTKWCGPCKLLDRNTFSDKSVITFVNENYYPVKFNAEGTDEITFDGFTYTNPNYQPERKGRNATHFFADALRLQGYPSLVFFEDNGTLIQAVPGYKTPKELEIYLTMIANDDYKKLTTVDAWETYRDNFKHNF